MFQQRSSKTQAATEKEPQQLDTSLNCPAGDKLSVSRLPAYRAKESKLSDVSGPEAADGRKVELLQQKATAAELDKSSDLKFWLALPCLGVGLALGGPIGVAFLGAAVALSAFAVVEGVRLGKLRTRIEAIENR